MDLDRVVEALAPLQDGDWAYTWNDVGCHFSCHEAETLAELLVAIDAPALADALIDGHADGDDDADDRHGRCRHCNTVIVREWVAEPWKHAAEGLFTDHVPQRHEKFGDDGRSLCDDGIHRPDDDPKPGDRCKDCGAKLSWRGPGPYDWDVVLGV